MLTKRALLCALGYLLGGILFSYHIPMWVSGVDVTRESADHNPGTANAVKYAGAPVGMMCLMADMAKGFIPVRLGMELCPYEYLGFALIMLAPVLGHATAPFYRSIRGGKAIAVSFGVLMALRPVSDAVWILAGLYILFSLVIVIRPDERRTVVTFASFALWALLFRIRRQASLALGCVLLSLVVVWKNRKSIPTEA